VSLIKSCYRKSTWLDFKTLNELHYFVNSRLSFVQGEVTYISLWPCLHSNWYMYKNGRDSYENQRFYAFAALYNSHWGNRIEAVQLVPNFTANLLERYKKHLCPQHNQKKNVEDNFSVNINFAIYGKKWKVQQHLKLIYCKPLRTVVKTTQSNDAKCQTGWRSKSLAPLVSKNYD